MSDVVSLWASNDPEVWKKALDGYMALVRPENVELEQRLENLGTERISKMSPEEWHAFLRDEYFVWKYTAKNRLATTRAAFDRYVKKHSLADLDNVRRHLLTLGPHIGLALKAAKKIGGLGVAGASGLLALMYPEKFGTVDQFVVKALQQVKDLPEADEIDVMEPKNLTLVDGVILTKILRRKATELGHGWTPRKVDAALWVVGRSPKFKYGDVCVHQDELYHIDGVFHEPGKNRPSREYVAHRIKITDHQFRGPNVVIPEHALQLLTGIGEARTIPMEELAPILAKEKELDAGAARKAAEAAKQPPSLKV
jgi:hypothetical protein